MDYRMDEIDRRVVYELMVDARNTSAPEIADEVGVSAGTIRNRIDNLEQAGILTGFHASVNFERAEGKLRNLYVCTVSINNRSILAEKARTIPGVTNVRELAGGERNLHLVAIGDDVNDLRRIARDISNCGINIVSEDLVQNEVSNPYQPYGPDHDREETRIPDLISLSGGSEIIEVVVREDAPVANKTLIEAANADLIDDDTLVISIERNDSMVTPRGETEIQPDDVVTLFSRGAVSEDVIAVFRPEEA